MQVGKGGYDGKEWLLFTLKMQVQLYRLDHFYTVMASAPCLLQPIASAAAREHASSPVGIQHAFSVRKMKPVIGKSIGQQPGTEKDRRERGDVLPDLDISVNTNIGFGRADNQDATWMAPATAPAALRRMGRLVAVADGMGGHKGGAIASRLACNALRDYYKRRPGLSETPVDLCRHLCELVYRIDLSVRWNAHIHPALEDMGTTLSCLVLTPRSTLIAHVGDSRIYRLRRGRLSMLTEDHTFVGEMIFEGLLTPEAASRHPLRHILTRSVGTGEQLEMVYSRIDRFFSDDRFLLCTDGLHSALASDRITDWLGRDSAASEIAAGLVDEALAQGSRDNITAMVVKPAQ